MLTVDRFKAVVSKMLEKALTGDTMAGKIILEYGLGKPLQRISEEQPEDNTTTDFEFDVIEPADE